MAGLVPAIHVSLRASAANKTWMAATTGSPPRDAAGCHCAAMTMWAVAAKMIQGRRENRTALISLRIPKLVRFAKIPIAKVGNITLLLHIILSDSIHNHAFTMCQ
jgi:hypothetical protein